MWATGFWKKYRFRSEVKTISVCVSLIGWVGLSLHKKVGMGMSSKCSSENLFSVGKHVDLPWKQQKKSIERKGSNFLISRADAKHSQPSYSLSFGEHKTHGTNFRPIPSNSCQSSMKLKFPHGSVFLLLLFGCCFFFPWGTFSGWTRIQAALLISSWQHSRDLDSAFGGLLHFRLQPIKPSPKLRCTEAVPINPSSLSCHRLPPLPMKNFRTQGQNEHWLKRFKAKKTTQKEICPVNAKNVPLFLLFLF